MRKLIVTIVIALAVVGMVIYVVETHARLGVAAIGVLAGAVLSLGLLMLNNKYALFVEILALTLLAYFTWKLEVKEIAMGAPVGALAGMLLVWGWVAQHVPYRHLEYKDAHQTPNGATKTEPPR